MFHELVNIPENNGREQTAMEELAKTWRRLSSCHFTGFAGFSFNYTILNNVGNYVESFYKKENKGYAELVSWSRVLQNYQLLSCLRNFMGTEVHSHVHKRTPMVSILSQMNLVHTLQTQIFNVNFSGIFVFRPTYS
jgi:hypothetical protein